ncbi:hypothetical protein KEG38_39260 [Polyangium jinanense]|uniref:hypothetical protein n=1 Tax=Polyangium jinanense TaxID=2829994 RepID=UPI002340CEDC|nr:hypothetical protein [Polyangium jinanense]MDC3959959.1 hypothetical protein [Polyangium jinanense]
MLVHVTVAREVENGVPGPIESWWISATSLNNIKMKVQPPRRAAAEAAPGKATMRIVYATKNRIQVTEDPLGLVLDTLEYGLSDVLAPEIDARLAPGGKGFHLENVFTIWRAEEPDDLPSKYWADPPFDTSRDEVWAIARDTWRGGSIYELIEGGELRGLLEDAKKHYAAIRSGRTAQAFPLGATMAARRYGIAERARGLPEGRFHRGFDVTNPNGPTILVTLGGKQARSLDELARELELAVPGVGNLRYVGPLDDTPAGVELDALAEEEPLGRPSVGSSATSRPFDLATTAGLGIALAAIVKGAHEAGLFLLGLRPELVYLDVRAKRTLITGVLPRHDRFLQTVNPPAPMAPWPAIYMAPEILLDQAKPTDRADVFSLCAILTRWATGEPPFAGDFDEQAAAMRRGERRAWTGPDELAAIVAQGLDPTPGRRPPLADVVAVLEPFAPKWSTDEDDEDDEPDE